MYYFRNSQNYSQLFKLTDLKYLSKFASSIAVFHQQRGSGLVAVKPLSYSESNNTTGSTTAGNQSLTLVVRCDIRGNQLHHVNEKAAEVYTTDY